MKMMKALILLDLYQVTCIKIYTLYCIQPCLGQTSPYLVFQTILDQIYTFLNF